MPVAAPATPDPNALELEEPHEPPQSSRNLKASPAVPSTSDVVELEQPLPVAERRPEPEPEPEEEPPVTVAPRTEPPPPKRPISEPPTLTFAKIASEPPPPPRVVSEPPPRIATEPPPAAIAEPVEPIRAAVAVQLAPVARPVEHVVVSIDADVIKPEFTPADVAAFVGAVREPRPASFGALLDAALDL
jgi:hypothetical protein